MIWILFGGRLIGNIGYWMTRPLIPLYLLSKFNAHPVLIGITASLAASFGVIGGLLGGILVDKIGRVRAMAISIGGQIAVFIGYALTESLALFLFFATIISLFSYLQVQVTDTVVSDLSSEENVSKNYSLLRIANNVGIALGPIIGMYIFKINPSLVFIITAVLTLLFGLIFSRFIDADKKILRSIKNERKVKYVEIIKHPRMISFIIAGIVLNVAISQMNTTLPVLLNERLDNPDTIFSWMWSINGVIVLLLQYILVKLTHKQNKEMLLIFSLIGYAIAFELFAVGNLSSVLILGMIFFSLSELIWFPYSNTYVLEQAKSGSKAMYVGSLSFHRIGFILGPILGTASLSITEGKVVFSVISILLILSSGILLKSKMVYQKNQIANKNNKGLVEIYERK
jgi:MFS family permease